LIGHEGSVLALLVIKERGWLVSSSSAGDVRVSLVVISGVVLADTSDLVYEEPTAAIHYSSM